MFIVISFGVSMSLSSSSNSFRLRFMCQPYWIWLLAAFYLFYVSQSYPNVAGEVDWISVFTEGFLAVLVATGLHIISLYRGQIQTYRIVFMGLALLLFAFITDTLDEFVDMPEILNFIVEGVFQDIGFLLIIVGLFAWVQETRENAARLHELATTDSLTGISNRRHFLEILPLHLSRSASKQSPLSLIVLDIDFFKQVNDEHGHNKGDDVLRKVAQQIHDEVGENGFVCRYGGEEFLIALHEADLSKAQALAEQIRSAVAAIRLSALQSLTVSLGVAQFDFQEDVDGLIHRADKALYEAKQSGRNKVVCAA